MPCLILHCHTMTNFLPQWRMVSSVWAMVRPQVQIKEAVNSTIAGAANSLRYSPCSYHIALYGCSSPTWCWQLYDASHLLLSNSCLLIHRITITTTTKQFILHLPPLSSLMHDACNSLFMALYDSRCCPAPFCSSHICYLLFLFCLFFFSIFRHPISRILLHTTVFYSIKWQIFITVLIPSSISRRSLINVTTPFKSPVRKVGGTSPLLRSQRKTDSLPRFNWTCLCDRNFFL